MVPLYLVATVAGKRVAIPADRIDSVVEIDTITPVPRAAAPVAGLAALRSRVITVIDPATIVVGNEDGGCQGRRPSVPGRAVVLAAGGHRYGVLVDSVEDVVEPDAPPSEDCGVLDARWARVATGMVSHGGRMALVIDPLRW